MIAGSRVPTSAPTASGATDNTATDRERQGFRQPAGGSSSSDRAPIFLQSSWRIRQLPPFQNAIRHREMQPTAVVKKCCVQNSPAIATSLNCGSGEFHLVLPRRFSIGDCQSCKPHGCVGLSADEAALTSARPLLHFLLACQCLAHIPYPHPRTVGITDRFRDRGGSSEGHFAG